MSEVTTFHALNRELACAALDQHTGTYSRQKVSAQAYCAAYVIAKRYGVDVTGFNLEYIAQRNECGKKDPQELRDFLMMSVRLPIVSETISNGILVQRNRSM